MRLFTRKSSKPAISPSDAQSSHSNGSLKSPAMPKSANGASIVKTLSPVPDVPLPKAPDPALDPAAYLRSIHAVRERSRLVLEKAKKNQLKHFSVDMTKFQETAGYVVSIIKVLYLYFTFQSSSINFPRCREIMLQTIPLFPLTAAGNTSK
jgi:hypothetical protein